MLNADWNTDHALAKHGKIRCTLIVDEDEKSLWVKISETGGLPTAVLGGSTTVHVRIYILPSDEGDKVIQTLFQPGIPTKSTLTRCGQLHAQQHTHFSVSRCG